MGEKRHRLYVRLHKRMPEAVPLSFPFHISLLLCKKTPDDTRSAVTFYLTNAPSKLFPVDEHYRAQWRVEQRLCNPQEDTDVLAMILVQKLSADHDIRYYEDLIAQAVEQTPLLQNVDKYDCAVWTWDILNRLHAMGAPFDTVPHIVGTTTSQLEQHMVDAAMEFAMQQQQHQMAATMAIRDDGVIDPVREGKLRKMLPGIKRRATNISVDSMETLVNHAEEGELAKKQRKRESFQQLQLSEKDFRNRVDERKPGPRKGWHDYWFHNSVGLIAPGL
ncbi:hypothetical protein D9619_003818 [Psilocybe cf. subviscida]|uniref:Uncharacterized protein n=1 Tax=Psilocybe cf. subviscida TaxID=2480587 RepID=A0A8H5EUU9_9AGAR|nr:hypothetical protein D9619_003818 [Psilocybe cf. subviscida]